MAEEMVELTEEEQYDSEYDKAWDDSEVAEVTEDEDLEQPEEESDADVDVPAEEEASEDSNPETEGQEETEEAQENNADDFVDVLKWKGKEIKVTDAERRALAQKGFDAEKKWQEAAINRPIKALIDKYGFTAEQLEMLGNITTDKNAEALALLAQQNDIDLYDAEHKNYQPKVEQRNYALDDVVAEINQNEEIATLMNDYVSSVPQHVKDRFIAEPEMLRGLNIDAQNGIAQQVMPEVIKQYAINPNQDFIQLYQAVGNKVFSQQAQAEPVKQEAKNIQPKATREDKKRVAVSTKAPTPDKDITDDYDAAWDDDAHFEAVRRRLQGF